MRKRFGTISILLGLLLLLGAAGLTVYNLNLDMNAGKESYAAMEEINSVLSKRPIKAAARHPGMPTGAGETSEPEPLELDGQYYMGVITFPTLELQLPVQNEWSYLNLQYSPCRMTGSPLTDDLVILGHNFRTHFGPLDRLVLGDEVSLTLIDGTTYIYYVDAIEVVAPTAVDSVTSGEWPLTLFTCTLSGTTRLVIRCELAE